MLPFSFEPTEEMPGGHCSRVYADATRVLKVPWRGEEMDSGWRASVLLSGGPGPQVFQVDEESGAVLMERVLPGTPMGEDADDDVFLDFVRVLQSLPTTDCLPLASFFESDLPQPNGGDAVFLHGDLHPFNILRSPDGWVLIDPKGLRGDPAFEAAAWLRNPIPLFVDLDSAEKTTMHRLERFEAEMGWERERMLHWTWLTLVEEDHDPEHPWHAATRLMERLLGE